jgi:hypothetical protein
LYLKGRRAESVRKGRRRGEGKRKKGRKGVWEKGECSICG